MDKIILRFARNLIIGIVLISLEFYLYNTFPFFAKQQLVIYFVAIFLILLSFQDTTKEYLYQNQILAITLSS